MIDRTVRGEIDAVAHLEARDHREVLVCVPTFGHATDSRLKELLISGGLLDRAHGKAGYETSNEEIIDDGNWHAITRHGRFEKLWRYLIV